MADLLILDSEALSALAHAVREPHSATRARAILTVAHERDAAVRVPVAVLAEVCRGGAREAAVLRVLGSGGIQTVGMNDAIARAAGALLEANRLDSRHAIDAFVVATTSWLGGGVIATGDPVDMTRLAARDRRVRVWRV